MTENDDDLLLEQFFQPARQMELADDGFTQRVKHRLPDRTLRLSRIWTAACVIVGVVVFTLLGGWHVLLGWGLRLMTTMPTTGQLAQLWLMLLVATALVLSEVVRREPRLRLY